jgi:hypothetical protein
VERDRRDIGPFFVWGILVSSDYTGVVLLYTGGKRAGDGAWIHPGSERKGEKRI